MWVGDGAADKRIDEFELGKGDVSMFRLAAEPGNSPNALVDIRLIELSLTAQEFVGHAPKAKQGKGRLILPWVCHAFGDPWRSTVADGSHPESMKQTRS